MTTSQTDETPRGPGLSGLLEILRRRRTLALLPFLFVLTAAASLAFFLPSLWTARALVLVNQQQIPTDFVKPTVQADLEARLLTLSRDILSAQRLQKIIADYNLYPSLRRHAAPDEVVDKMRKDIHLELAGASDRERSRDQRAVAFTVSYTAPNRVVSAMVTNTLAALYTDENRRLREQQAEGATAFLDSQLNDLRQKLQAQEHRITEYKERYMGELPEQRDVNLRTLERLEAQLQLASENNRRANERRALITQSLGDLDLSAQMAGGPGSTASGPDVTPAQTAAARLALLKQELAEMQTKYSDRYPDVIQMREQIRALEVQVQADKRAEAARARRMPAASPRPAVGKVAPPQNAYVASLMQQLDQANVDAKATTEEMANLKRDIAVYQRRLENTPRREQELALITRDYNTTQDLFRSLLTKRGEAGVASELEQRQKGETYQVIQPASLPERPTGPNRFRLLLVGLVLALGASGVAVVLAEQVDTSFRRVDEVRAALPAPLLSTIPRITTEQDRLRGMRQRRLATAAVAFGLLAVATTSFAVAHNNVSLVSVLTGDTTTAVKR